MNYYERHIGDYLKDTAHLSLLEHGIYARLLDVYYTRESGIPDDQVYRLIGARTDDEKGAVDGILEEFFRHDGGEHYIQARCDREIQRFKDKQAQAKRAAQASVASRQASAERAMNGRSTGDERALNVPSLQSPVSIPREREKTQRASRLPAAWVLPQDWREWAQEHRRDIDPDLTAAKFADFWHSKPGKDGCKLDWLATWRNWVREERPPRTSPADVARITVPASPAASAKPYLDELAAHRKAVEAERLNRKQTA